MVICQNYLWKSNPKELLPLLLALLPLTGHADVGNLGGVAATAGTVLAALWVSVTLFVFFLFGRKPILVSCFLTAPRMWRGQLMPGGAFITADGGKE